MSERSKGELYWGIIAIAIGVLYTGVELYYLTVFGQHSEYFGGWWIAYMEVVLGVFLLLRYRFERVRRLSKAVGESVYFELALVLFYLVVAGLGVYVGFLASSDLGGEGAIWVFGFGAFFGIVGLVGAGKTISDSEHL